MRMMGHNSKQRMKNESPMGGEKDETNEWVSEFHSKRQGLETRRKRKKEEADLRNSGRPQIAK
jgi:hypothetical protein